MRIMWSVNISFPKVAQALEKRHEYGGGWMRSLFERIQKEPGYEMGIVSVYDGTKIKTIIDGNTKYYLLPGGDNVKKTGGGRKAFNNWEYIVSDFKPDIIHIFGTEYSNNLNLIRHNYSIPIIVSLQGILTEYYKHYYGGLSVPRIIFTRSLRDWVKCSGLIADKKKFGKGIKTEQEILHKVRFVEGRTNWDRIVAHSINSNLKYYHCPRMLREPFYGAKWDINKVERYSLYTSQAVYPIKGLHFLLESVSILKKKYPEVKLYIAGVNICDKSSLYKRFKRTGYALYIEKLIKKLDLTQNVIFTGILNAHEIKERLLKTHVFVLPSVIENSPNSLAEAMILGVPSVASFVGGTPDMLDHNREGFLYNYCEPIMLAEYISKYFDSDECALTMSNNARETASKRHDKEYIYETIKSIYNDIKANG